MAEFALTGVLTLLEFYQTVNIFVLPPMCEKKA